MEGGVLDGGEVIGWGAGISYDVSTQMVRYLMSQEGVFLRRAWVVSDLLSLLNLTRRRGVFKLWPDRIPQRP